MIQYKKLMMTLALLLTAVGGAWAEDYTTVFELNGSTASVGKLTLGTSSVETGKVKIHENTDEIAGINISGTYNYEGGKYFTIAPETGSFKKGDKVSIAVCFNNNDNTKFVKAVIYADDHETLLYTTAEGINGRTTNDDPVVEEYVLTQDASVLYIGRNGNTNTFVTTLKVERPASAEPDIDVKWNATTKTGTFSMPGSDVVLTPQYAPTAKWDVVENVEQLPAALEGIIAGQDAAIVTPGQSAQGTPMYAVTTTAETAPALEAFSATVPTAKTYDDATTVYVWYYIQGQDTPDGQQATEENTFNDSEISATPLKVDILTNKFDLTLKPAPVKNMTVTVAGQAKTPTDEGKVTGVKMESEVKLKAAQGYKFRKVEVKKGAAGPKYADVVTMCEKNGDNKYLISSFFDGTNANITTITKEEAIALAEYLGGGNIRVVYEEFGFSGDRYASATNAAGDEIGIPLSTTNTSKNPLYYVPAGN